MYKFSLMILALFLVACSEQNDISSAGNLSGSTSESQQKSAVSIFDESNLNAMEISHFEKLEYLKKQIENSKRVEDTLLISRELSELAVLYFEGINGYPKSTDKSIEVLNDAIIIENNYIDLMLKGEAQKLKNVGEVTKKKKLNNLNAELMRKMDGMAAAAYIMEMQPSLQEQNTHLSQLTRAFTILLENSCKVVSSNSESATNINKCVYDSFGASSYLKSVNLFLLSKLKQLKPKANPKALNYALKNLPAQKIPDLHKSLFLKWLISNGADVNYKANERDSTALYVSIEELTDNESQYSYDTYELTSELLRHGANPNLGPKDYKGEFIGTAVSELIKKASSSRRQKELNNLLQLMIKNEIDFSFKSSDGYSLLALSSFYGLPDITKAILNTGETANQKNKVYLNRKWQELTPLEIAVKKKQIQLEQVFIDAGFETGNLFEAAKTEHFAKQKKEQKKQERLKAIAAKTPYYAKIRCRNSEAYKDLEVRECLSANDGYIEYSSGSQSGAFIYDDLSWDTHIKIMLGKSYHIEGMKGSTYTSNYKLIIEVFDVLTDERIDGMWTVYIQDKISVTSKG
mgnify:CR=1 FL=1